MPEPLTDSELINRYLEAGQNDHFNHLYLRYHQYVYTICLQFTQSNVEAEDFTHDVFVKLLDRLQQFKGDAKFTTWLTSVARNYCIDQLRRNQKKETSLQPFMYDCFISNTLEQEDNWGIMQTALQQLSDDERSLLTARYLREEKIKDIARAQKVTQSAVKMRLFRIRERLRTFCLEIQD